jgi:hypothetical protein
LLLLALCLFGFTLVVPLLVWPMTNWRTALSAWWQYGRYMLILYAVGAVVWAGIMLGS